MRRASSTDTVPENESGQSVDKQTDNNKKHAQYAKSKRDPRGKIRKTAKDMRFKYLQMIGKMTEENVSGTSSYTVTLLTQFKREARLELVSGLRGAPVYGVLRPDELEFLRMLCLRIV